MLEDISIGKEKRQYVRINTKLIVRLKTNDESVETIYEGTSNNISEGGLSMRVEDKIDKLLNKLASVNFGFNVSIQLLNPEEEVNVDAVTRWTISKIEWVKIPPHKREILHIGLAFRDVPETTLKLIRYHINNSVQKNQDDSASSASWK